jgi:nucleoside-diphosphate-sugar epimerase
VKIAEEAKKQGVKSFVFASSCSVYGLADVNAKNESSDINPLTAYAKSKTNCEEDLRKVAGNDFVITCLRFATACGFSYRLRLDLVLNDFVASALANKKIEILSDGKPWRPLINVKDMARAMEWAVYRTPEPNYIIINAGSDSWNYQVIDLAKAVQKIIPEIEVHVNPNAQPDNRSYKVDFSLFAKMAKGYTPQYDLETTIKELISGLSAIGFSDKNFRTSNLIRLKTLTEQIDKGVLTKELVLN